MKLECAFYGCPLDSQIVSKREREPIALLPYYTQLQKMIPSRLAEQLVPASGKLRPTYLRSLRAAEMALWEITGGDYLRSSVVT